MTRVSAGAFAKAGAGETIWLTRMPRTRPLDRAGPRRAALGRGVAVVAVAALAGVMGLTALPPPDLAAAAPAPREAASPKASARLSSWNGPVAAGPERPAATSEPRDPGLFDAVPFLASPQRLAAAPSGDPAGMRAFARAEPRDRSPGAWRDAEFPRVDAVDGRTLDAGEVRIVLAGIDLPDPAQMCRTLDGRLEPCAVRARTQLELLTRSRAVSCRLRGEGVAEGSCRVGSSDIAERLLRTGFVHRRDDGPRTVAFVETTE